MGLNCHMGNLNVSNQDAPFFSHHFAVGCILGVLRFVSEQSFNSRQNEGYQHKTRGIFREMGLNDHTVYLTVLNYFKWMCL